MCWVGVDWDQHLIEPLQQLWSVVFDVDIEREGKAQMSQKRKQPLLKSPRVQSLWKL